MNGDDWLWAVGGFVAVGVLTGGVGTALGLLPDETKLHPSFLAFEPLGPGRYWILGAWLTFFVLNIVGEEFVWRGVVLPRQEVVFRGRAWLVNGVLWLLFHAAFPWQVLLTLVPITLILPYVVQRRRSTWVGGLSTPGSEGWASWPSPSDLPKSPHGAEPTAAADGGGGTGFSGYKGSAAPAAAELRRSAPSFSGVERRYVSPGGQWKHPDDPDRIYL
jgi:hypothetical protein